MHVGHKHKTVLLLQTLDKVPGDFDDVSAIWKTRYTIRGSVRPARTSERLEGSKVDSRISHVIDCRYLEGVTSSWRVVIEDGTKRTDQDKRILNIDSVVEHDRQYLELRCIE